MKESTKRTESSGKDCRVNVSKSLQGRNVKQAKEGDTPEPKRYEHKADIFHSVSQMSVVAPA